VKVFVAPANGFLIVRAVNFLPFDQKTTLPVYFAGVNGAVFDLVVMRQRVF